MISVKHIIPRRHAKGREEDQGRIDELGSPWENGYIESFNGKLRDELLIREVFYTWLKVRVPTKRYRRTYNRIRPHSSLGYRPAAPEAL